MSANGNEHEPAVKAIDEMAMKSERKLREMLVDLHREYQMLAAPIIKALVDIEATKPPQPFLMRVHEVADVIKQLDSKQTQL